MGFANTAAYFTQRANDAREPDEKQRLLEVAGFYCKLAGIIPDFPAGYTAHRWTGRAGRWEERAEECRALADCLSNPKCRAQMMDLADMYAGLSKAAE